MDDDKTHYRDLQQLGSAASYAVVLLEARAQQLEDLAVHLTDPRGPYGSGEWELDEGEVHLLDQARAGHKFRRLVRESASAQRAASLSSLHRRPAVE